MYEFEDIKDQKLVVDINGKMTECDLLFTYDGENIDKPIVGYTDQSTNERGELNIFVSKYDPLYGSDKLEPVTDKEELELVNEVIEQIKNQYK